MAATRDACFYLVKLESGIAAKLSCGTHNLIIQLGSLASESRSCLSVFEHPCLKYILQPNGQSFT